MGGSDAFNATSRVLDALLGAPLPAETSLNVILGAHQNYQDCVREKAKALPWPTDVTTYVSNIAERMKFADLAIGAAGATTWERCCLGLPTVSVQIADNQREISLAVAQAGAAINAGPIQADDFSRNLQAAVSEAATNARLTELSLNAASICDGKGVGRVLESLCLGDKKPTLIARYARSDDAYNIWRWRNADSANRFYRNPKFVSLGEHLKWFGGALNNPYCVLLIVEHDSIPLGHVRLDLDNEMQEHAEISIYVNPVVRGKGHGSAILEVAIQKAKAAGIERFTADIHQDNPASLHLFRKVGFVPFTTDGKFVRLCNEPPPRR
jgi:RimJ/RimL family protein N-acetyltransferase